MGWAKDFSSNFVLKIAGILYVFQDFYKQKLEKKIRPERKKEFLEVPSNLSHSLSVDGCRGGSCVKSNMVYTLCNNMVYNFF